jgi:hypothetical protein
MKWLLLLLLLAPISATAQLPDAPKPKVHKFYDKPGKILLGSAAALAAADVGQSCHYMANGGYEMRTALNPWPAKNCGMLSVQLFGQVAIQEGVAYFLHRTGHHKLERVTRFFSMEENVYGIIYTRKHQY